MKFKKAIFVILSYILICSVLSSCSTSSLRRHIVPEGIVESKTYEMSILSDEILSYKVKISGKCFYCEEETSYIYKINEDIYKNIEIGDHFDYSD